MSGSRPSRIVAIASGKGGVGKTWFTITLGHALALAGQRVLLFDGDLGLANIDVQLGLTVTGDLGDVIAGQRAFEDVVQRHAGGFDVVAGRSGSGAFAGVDPVALEHVLAALRRHARQYDVVLLDLGAGLERAVRRMAIFADALLVLATEDPTSLTDAYAVLKVYAGDAGRHASVVVNLAGNLASGQRTYGALRTAAQRFLGHAPACAGVIRRDARVLETIRRQSLLLALYPACPAALDVKAIAAAVIPA